MRTMQWITVLVVGLLCGCGSLTETVYHTSGTAHVTARTALLGWNDYLATHEVSEAAELRVKAAYEKYQAAQIALLSAAIVWEDAQNPDNEARLEQATASAGEALAALVKLVRTLGVKL